MDWYLHSVTIVIIKIEFGLHRYFSSYGEMHFDDILFVLYNFESIGSMKYISVYLKQIYKLFKLSIELNVFDS